MSWDVARIHIAHIATFNSKGLYLKKKNNIHIWMPIPKPRCWCRDFQMAQRKCILWVLQKFYEILQNTSRRLLLKIFISIRQRSSITGVLSRIYLYQKNCARSQESIQVHVSKLKRFWIDLLLNSLLISFQSSRINGELRAFLSLLLRTSKPTGALRTCREDITNNQGDLLQKR